MYSKSLQFKFVLTVLLSFATHLLGVEVGEVWIDEAQHKYKVTKKLGEGSLAEVFEVKCIEGPDHVGEISAMKFAKDIYSGGELHLSAQEVLRFYGSEEHKQLNKSGGQYIQPYEEGQIVWPQNKTNFEARHVVRTPVAAGTLRRNPFEIATREQREFRSNLLYEAGVGGLIALHENGLVHGDIKPENYLIQKGEVVFGQTIKLGDLDGVVKQETPLKVFTAYYAAPERLRYLQSLKALPTEDAFSLAQVLTHEMFGEPLLVSYVKRKPEFNSAKFDTAYILAVSKVFSDPEEARQFYRYVESKLENPTLPQAELEKNKIKFIKAAYRVDPLERERALSETFPDTFGKAYKKSGLTDRMNQARLIGGMSEFLFSKKDTTEEDKAFEEEGEFEINPSVKTVPVPRKRLLKCLVHFLLLGWRK